MKRFKTYIQKINLDIKEGQTEQKNALYILIKGNTFNLKINKVNISISIKK